VLPVGTLATIIGAYLRGGWHASIHLAITYSWLPEKLDVIDGMTLGAGLGAALGGGIGLLASTTTASKLAPAGTILGVVVGGGVVVLEKATAGI
jgi:hypothetical protein